MTRRIACILILLQLSIGHDARADMSSSAITPGRTTSASLAGVFPSTKVTISDASSTIGIANTRSPVVVTLITSAPTGSTTLTSNPCIDPGTDGQLLILGNASSQTIVLPGGNGVAVAGSTLTFGQTAIFLYVSAFGAWVELASTSTNLDSTTTGTLTITNGGTGTSTLNAHHILLGQGTSAITTVPAMGAHQLVVGTSTTTDPVNQTVVGQCTLNGSSTATCTATVTSGCTPTCTYNSSTTAHTIACSVSGTTLTAVSGTANDSGTVSWSCI